MLAIIGIILSYVCVYLLGNWFGWESGWKEGNSSRIKHPLKQPEKDPNESHPCHIPTNIY
jgi:hypothetical protein